MTEDTLVRGYRELARATPARPRDVVLRALDVLLSATFVILSSPLINGERLHIAELALKNRLPTISLFTEFPKSGALMAYGPNLPDMYRRAAIYVDRVLKGAKASDLPIERPSRFELEINLKTARALDVEVPPTLLARTDEVIE